MFFYDRIFCPQFWGRKWLRQYFIGTWKKCAPSAGRSHVHEIPRFGGEGGVFWVLGVGGGADFIFMGAGIFPNWLGAKISAQILGAFFFRNWGGSRAPELGILTAQFGPHPPSPPKVY